MRSILHGMAIVILAMASTRCSMAGLGVGMDIDGRKPDTITRTTPDVLALSPGSPIEAVLIDGSAVAGEYSNPLAESGEAYGPAFARSHESLLPDHPIPGLGDRVALGRGSTVETAGSPALRFVGADRQRAFLRTSGNGKAVRWAELDVLVSRQGTLAGSVLAELTATGQIPSVHGVSLRNGDVRTPIPLTDVREFRTRPSRNAKWVGLGIGLIIDAAVIVVVAGMDFDFGCPPFSSEWCSD